MRGDDIMAKADRNRATATSRMESRPNPTRSSARRTTRKPAEPRLLTRPEVAEALGVSERTARRMAGDPSCPLGPGERRMRKLYWTSEAVEDARLWRAEQEHRAESVEAPTPAAKAATPKAKAVPKDEAAPKPAPKAKSAKAKPTTAKPSKASAAETRSAAKPKPASKTKPTAKPKTAAKTARKPSAAKSASTKRPATPKTAPVAAAPVPLTPAALFDTETLAALLPLLDADMRLLSPARQAEMLRAAGAALRRLLGPALAAARAQAGLPPIDRPEPPALGRLNRYEFSVLARSARMAAPLMPPRRPWATAG